MFVYPVFPYGFTLYKSLCFFSLFFSSNFTLFPLLLFFFPTSVCSLWQPKHCDLGTLHQEDISGGESH